MRGMGSYTATAFGTKMAKIQANIGLNPLEHRHRYANEYGILLIKIYRVIVSTDTKTFADMLH